jgi:hypothetical protein
MLKYHVRLSVLLNMYYSRTVLLHETTVNKLKPTKLQIASLANSSLLATSKHLQILSTVLQAHGFKQQKQEQCSELCHTGVDCGCWRLARPAISCLRKEEGCGARDTGAGTLRFDGSICREADVSGARVC